MSRTKEFECACLHHRISSRTQPSIESDQVQRTFIVNLLLHTPYPRILDRSMTAINCSNSLALNRPPHNSRRSHSPLNNEFDTSTAPPPSSTIPKMAPGIRGPPPPPAPPKRLPCCCAFCSARWRSAKLRGKPPDIFGDAFG